MIEVLSSNTRGRLLSADIFDSMFRLRSAVFCDRLGWELDNVSGRERDWFDDLNPTYMVARDRARPTHALGCWRLLPTTGPYMLRDVFPELLDGQAAPRDARVWEISRLAVSPETHAPDSPFGFGEIPVAMLRRLFAFSCEIGIDAFVTVTSVAVERMVKKLGLPFHRMGQPRRFGGVANVAFNLPMDARAEAILGPQAVKARHAA